MDRPWTPPPGYMCLHESYFEKAHLFFPLPRAIVEFCARKGVAISQVGTATMIDLMGLLVYGSELGIVVGASHLEMMMKLVRNKRSPGTFYTQAGIVRNKPERINNWQLNYFYVKVNEASTGRMGPVILSEWNRLLGTEGHEDCYPRSGVEPYSSELKRILDAADRDYALFTKERVEKLRGWLSEREGNAMGTRGGIALQGVSRPVKGVGVGSSTSVIRPTVGGKSQPAMSQIRSAAGRVVLTEEDSEESEEEEEDEELLSRRKKAVMSVAEQPRGETGEVDVIPGGGEVSGQVESGRDAALAVVRVGTEKRKAKESRGEEGGGVTIRDLAGRVTKRARTGTSRVGRPPSSSTSKRDGKKVVSEGGRSHQFQMIYEGDTSVVLDPEMCGKLLQRIPEADDKFVGGEVDLNAAYDEFAALVFRLANSKNRYVRGHEEIAVGLKKEISKLEGEVASLRGENSALKEENVALRTLEKDVEVERELRAAKEKEVVSHEVDLGAERAEVAELNVRLRVEGELLRNAEAELGQCKEENESLKGEVEELRREAASLRERVIEKEDEKSQVEQRCRSTLKRLLQQNADALYAGYLAKNKYVMDEYEQYLKDREKVEEVEGKLNQAEGVIEVLKKMEVEYKMEVPEDMYMELRKNVSKYEVELGDMELEEFTLERLRLGLPDSIGEIDVDNVNLGIVSGGVPGERGGEAVEKEQASASESGGFIDVVN